MIDERRSRIAKLDRAIWDSPLTAMPVWKTRLVRLTRLLFVLARDLFSEQLTLRAMSLVYTTLLSIVPLLALSFSVLKAFGVYNQIEPALQGFLAPLGDNADEISSRIIGFIANMNVGVLGSVGLALLIYTSVSLIQKLEEAFNRIWHITEARKMGERFSRYLSVLMVGPILVFSAIGITATLMNLNAVRSLVAIEPFGRLFFYLTELMPYVLVSAAFSFIYIFIPNTRVRMGPAVIGGLVGGVLWQSAGWAFALFAKSATTYSAVYSSFAILVLFMIWMYVSWLILLFGASVTFYNQNPQYVVGPGGEPRLSNRMRERAALAVMSLIADHFLKGRPGWTMQQLSQKLHVPMHAVQAVLGALEESGILMQSKDDPPAYVPARELRAVTVAQLIETVRRAGENRYLNPAALAVPDTVELVLERFDRSLDASLSDISVEALATEFEGPGTKLDKGNA